MGKAVLASQFAAGLLPEIKAKVAGNEGDLEALLTKARFEEAKIRNLRNVPRKAAFKPQPSPHITGKQLGGGEDTTSTRSKASTKCYGCGAQGHYRLTYRFSISTRSSSFG